MTDKSFIEPREQQSQIYQQGYEKWSGEREYFIPPWLLIGKTVLRNVFTHSGCLGRLFFIFVVIIPMGIYYFFALGSTFTFFQAENLKDLQFFSIFSQILQQLPDISVGQINKSFVLIPSLVFTPIAMVFYGSQLISKDKAANALQVYFSKAISRWDYVLGKYFAVGVMTASVTLVPSAMILGVGLVFTTDYVLFFQQSWYIPFLTITYWAILTLVYGSITLAFSAMFSKSYMAAVGIIGFQIFCAVLSFLLIQIFGATDFLNGFNWAFSLWGLGSSIFDLSIESPSATFWRLIDMGLIAAAGVVVVFRKINPVEVIK